MRICWLLFFTLVNNVLFAQGNLTGNVTDEKSKALESATVQLIPFLDSSAKLSTTTDKNGAFIFQAIPYGYYKLRLTYISLQPVTIDSLYVRAERPDFNLPDIILKPRQNKDLDEIIIYAEKPLFQTKDGNITFNAGES